MNEQEFQKVTNRLPEKDDLDRANCNEAGKLGHQQCGICPTCGKPRFMCTTVQSCEPDRYYKI